MPLASTIWCLCCLFLGALYVVVVYRQNRRLQKEPRVVFSWLPWLGSSLAFGKDAYEFVKNHRRKYGSVFTAVVGGERTTFVCDDALGREMMRKSSLFAFGPVGGDVMRRVFGLTEAQVRENQLKFDDEIHRIYRDHLLHTTALTALRERVDATLEKAIAELPSGELDLYKDVAWGALWPATVEATFGPELIEAREDFRIFDEGFALLAAGLPAFDSVRARNRLLRRFESPSYHDKAAKFIKRRVEVFRDASPGFEAASQAAMLWAVVANTIPAAFWALFFALERGLDVRDEARVAAAVTEALRLTSGSLTVRRAMANATLGQHAIRAGDRLVVFPMLRHLDATVFPDPLAFDEGRHLGEKPAPPIAPFGGGVSMCPGRKFATVHIAAFLRKVLSACDIKLLHPRPSFDNSRTGLGIFPPHGQVRVTLTKRVL